MGERLLGVLRGFLVGNPAVFLYLYASVFQQETAIKGITRINMRKKALVCGKVIFYKSVYSDAQSICSGNTPFAFSQKGFLCVSYETLIEYRNPTWLKSTVISCEMGPLYETLIEYRNPIG